MAEWKGVHYNDGDMLRLQQEAIRRVRQMQQRAERTVGNVKDVDFVEVPEPRVETISPSQAPQAPDTPPAHGHPDTQFPRAGSAASHAPPRQQGGNLLSQLTSSLGLGSKGGGLGGIASSLSGLGGLGGLGGIGEKLSGLGEKLGLGGSAEGAEGESHNFITAIVGEDSPIAKVLAALNIDNERMILIGLLLILLNEKADKTLLIALVYLLL